MQPKHLYLIDGSGFIFRAYYGYPSMSRADGTPTNAVYGFCTMVNKLIKQTDADLVAVVFDKARRNFRNEIYPDYKANRDDAPDDLIPQFNLIRQACKAYNIPMVEMDNYEADDLIATYAKIADDMGAEVSIVSSDKDLMQLVNDNITMFDAMKNITINREKVFEKFGVYPERVIDVQSLAGDSSDNIPGVPGIGIKTASQLIEEFGDLENLLANAHTIKQNKRRQNLIDYADVARMSKQLVTLKNDVPIEIGLEHFTRKQYDKSILREFLLENNFKRLLSQLDSDVDLMEQENNFKDNKNNEKINNSDNKNKSTDLEEKTILNNSMFNNLKTEYISIHTADELVQWLSGVKTAGILSIDTETTGLHIIDCDIVGISMSYEYGKACYIPINHSTLSTSLEQDDLFAEPAQENVQSFEQIPVDKVVEILKPILLDSSILKVGQNIKYDISILKKIGLDIKPFDDTMLLSYCFDSGRAKHNMNDLAKRHLNHDCIKFEDVCGKGKKQILFSQTDIKKATDYACEDADITLRLHTLLKNRIVVNSVVSVYENLERPLIPVIAHMESAGIKVEREKLDLLSQEFGKKIEATKQKVLDVAIKHGMDDFNVASPKQLSELLFKKIGISGGKKTKSGGYSTNSDVLESIYDENPIIQDILKYRQDSKLKSTYTDALQTQISPKTNRVHSSFNMAGTTTGRLSSSEPNLQNIPVRSNDGKKIRECFIADTGKLFLSLDYSQIELRLVAHMSGDKEMIKTFNNGGDIHISTAQSMFGVDKVDSDMRSRAKVINFGIIYGVSPHGLARQVGCSRTQAKEFIDSYFKAFPGIRIYMENTKQYSDEKGYVKTLFGRKIHLPDAHSNNSALRGHAHRQAINSPIQGTSADIIKIAMIKIYNEIYNKKDIKLLLQIHDELIFEIDEDKVEKYQNKIKTIMENSHTDWLDLSVPLVVDSGISKVWKK
ncbi:DNA polymerase I [Alphaproteobacteria bacterium]|nr:DNA polymerase I [Alphaproteobacteria bacterium]